MNKAPTTLIIMDGFGLTDPGPGNAVSLAQTPQLDRLFAEYAHTTLSASGLDVGLPAGQMGNSEVGHTNIGGGRAPACTCTDCCPTAASTPTSSTCTPCCKWPGTRG